MSLGIISGCLNARLRNDFRPSPLDTGYHSAEIIVSGEHYFGVTAQRADIGQPFVFEVGGIANGTIEITSTECNLQSKKTYTNFANVKFEVTSPAKRCLIQIFVFPQFTADQANKIQWRGLSGIILLRRSARTLARISQIRSGADFSVDLDLKEDSRVYLAGCGTRHDETVNRPMWSLRIESNLQSVTRQCVIDGFIKGKSGITDVAILISRFSDDVQKLPIPEIKFNRRSFTVNGDASVAVIGFNGKAVYGSRAKFMNDTGLLRLYSVKGRSVFCEIGEGVAKCFN